MDKQTVIFLIIAFVVGLFLMLVGWGGVYNAFKIIKTAKNRKKVIDKVMLIPELFINIPG